ncbi:MAG TPA: TlyA family rRNA (cytidine-2'-O)-methyltransferase, partial [Rhodospirillaceae bacterium]|nr:TlyA family rRNA (cytidine-2'-O)-methyltransferase [Rhodospirillaceae bacterium]
MAKAPKIRLDQLLVDRGLADSRTKAQALVMAGLVFGTDRRFDKPGAQIAADTEISVKGKDHP